MSCLDNLHKVHKATVDSVNVAGLSEYSYKSLVYKEEIGLGGYAVVFTAKLSGEGRGIVVKTLLDSPGLAKSSMIKEARLLLNFINMRNCVKQFAILLEHVVEFDFLHCFYSRSYRYYVKFEIPTSQHYCTS